MIILNHFITLFALTNIGTSKFLIFFSIFITIGYVAILLMSLDMHARHERERTEYKSATLIPRMSEPMFKISEKEKMIAKKSNLTIPSGGSWYFETYE